MAVGFVLGLVFGSFLNVCIARIPRRQSVVHPRSLCPSCGVAIRWYDNIPLLSWIFLRARCRDCKHPISLQYPLVELAVGVWFLVQAKALWMAQATADHLHTPASWMASQTTIHLGLAVLGFLLIGLMVMDWQTGLLPDAFTLWGIAIALLLTLVQAFFLGPTEDQVVLTNHHLRLSSPGSFVDQGNVFLTGPESLIFGRVAAICEAALILLCVRWLYKALRHREGMGLGDVKLLAMIAAFLGFWPAVLALFAGVFTASVYAVFLVARAKAGAASRLAFGSFLAIGGLVAAQFGNRLINMYIALLR
jgi:leader peptidase (prepilin peptidase)/N-methyltransferase